MRHIPSSLRSRLPASLLVQMPVRLSMRLPVSLPISLIVLLLAATSAQAACYADYKAKQDNPLRLHYGVSEVRGDCSVANAEAELRPKLAADGWQLLNVVGLFDDSGLAERRESAGDFYLRY